MACATSVCMRGEPAVPRDETHCDAYVQILHKFKFRFNPASSQRSCGTDRGCDVQRKLKVHHLRLVDIVFGFFVMITTCLHRARRSPDCCVARRNLSVRSCTGCFHFSWDCDGNSGEYTPSPSGSWPKSWVLEALSSSCHAKSSVAVMDAVTASSWMQFPFLTWISPLSRMWSPL